MAVAGLDGRLIPNPEPIMTVARTVADVLTEHVIFEVECIDRMFLNVLQPKLQYAARSRNDSVDVAFMLSV